MAQRSCAWPTRAPCRPARAPTSSCSTRTRWTTSRIRGASRRWCCAARRWTARSRCARLARLGSRLQHQVIDVAPAPVVAGIKVPDDGVLGLVEMLRRVLAGRVVAAADVAATEAQSKMNPSPVRLEAFLAALWRARLDVADLVEVSAVRSQARFLRRQPS